MDHFNLAVTLSVFSLIAGGFLLFVGAGWKGTGKIMHSKVAKLGGVILMLYPVVLICIQAKIGGFIPMLVLDIIGVIIFVKFVSSETKGIKEEKMRAFYKECVETEAVDFSYPKNVQRVQLLADKYKLIYPEGIEKLFLQSKELYEGFNEKEAKEKELAKFNDLNKYSDLTGKDKRIAMLKAEAARFSEYAEHDEKVADAFVRSGLQKEKDWATAGGIASGIAGPAAGIATAINVQNKNAEIRAKNEQHLQSVRPIYNDMMGKAGASRRIVEDIRKEIEDFKLKLVSDVNSAELMKKISFSNTTVSVSNTGAATVSTTASLQPDFKIFDDVPAVVDGTIIAEIYDGDKRCGTALLVLPKYGLGENCTLTGMCLDCCNPGKTYTVKFTPKHLWALEA